MVSNKKTFEIMRFGLVGVIATTIHYSVYWMLRKELTVYTAYTIGYGLSFLCNYYLSSVLTFKVQPTFTRLFRFGTGHLFNWFMQMILLNFFLLVDLPEKWLPVPVLFFSFPICYYVTRYAMKHEGNRNTIENGKRVKCIRPTVIKYSLM